MIEIETEIISATLRNTAGIVGAATWRRQGAGTVTPPSPRPRG